MIRDGKPRLARAARLRHDHARDRWLLLAPERGYVLNPSALAIVRLLDGTRSVEEIQDQLGAPPRAIASFVGALATRGLVE